MRKREREWVITITSWPKFTMIVKAQTSGKARYIAWFDGQQAGYDIPFIRYRAKLAPK